MSATVKSWSIALLALCAVAFASLGSAQTWPMRKAHQGAIGNNGTPAITSPGAAVLNWFYPSPTAGAQIETDQSSFANYLGLWLAPVFGGAASDTFQFDGTGNPIPDALEGINFNVPYLYSPVIACDHLTNNPLIPDALAVAAGHTFSIASFPIVTPLVQGNVAGDYALSAWLPAGATADINGNLTFPSQFIVFEIDYGTNLHYVDIVDRNQAGSGFVRLGNGGLPTTQLFHYDGVNPIVIHEYNTIPRAANGLLIGVGNVDAGHQYIGPPATFYTYANAVEATQTYGSVLSSPVIENDLTTGDARHVYVAANRTVNLLLGNGQYTTQNRGVLTAYQSINTQINAFTNLPSNGLQTVNWTFSPIDQGQVGQTLDRPSAGVQSTPGWSIGNNASFPPFVGYIGTDFLYKPTTNNPAAEDVASYGSLGAGTNLLANGSYDVLMWTPGAQASANFAQFVQVEIDEGAAQTFLTVDLTTTNGYLPLGGRRFVNTAAAPLIVRITNFSANAADVGKFAYADAVRFVGTANLEINSTPVHVKIPVGITTIVGGLPVYSTQMKSVVLTAGEDGRIYCLDANGRHDPVTGAPVNDGTTDVYWAYPSIPDPTLASWTDPNNNASPGQPAGYPYGNQRDGSLGVTNALMPTGFDLSSALVQEVPVGSGNFFLYIASNNGRIYCIDTAGRGDFNLATRRPGTTSRVWTFPNDYRPDNPAIPSVPSALGGGNASLVYNTNISGPTIFVPAAQGRMYALDALGTAGSATTTTKWTFPATTNPTLGPINSTPAIGTPQNSGDAMIYFGTERKNGSNVGQFFALDVETGLSKWFFQGAGLTATDVADDFEGGPALAFGGVVGDIAHPDYLFVANQNGYVYALDPDNNGALLWETNELQSGVSAPLSYTHLNVFGNVGGLVVSNSPTVMVPTDSGFFMGLFANANTTNSTGGRLNYGYQAAGDRIVSGMAVSTTYPNPNTNPPAGVQMPFMYGADDLGFVYGFSGGLPGGVGGVSGGPGADVGVPNDPESQEFANAKVGFYLGTSYNQIRTLAGPDYTTWTAAGNFLNRNPAAFDFGEVLYVMVYNFPSRPAGGVPTASVSYTVTVEGRTLRQTQIQARQFTNAPTDTQGNALDGFTILAFPLQPSGINAMAPGDGSVSYTIQEATSSTTNNRKVFFNPGQKATPFFVANPLGIAMAIDNANYGVFHDSLGADNTNTADATSTGPAFASPANWQNRFNGSINYSQSTDAVGFDPTLMLSSPGIVSHANTGTTSVSVFDRSLMVQLTGPDIPGISNIRLDRTNMAFNGGYNAIVKPFGGPKGLYNGTIPQLEQFEDWPTQFPNISFDYGDIPRQYLLATSNPTGASANPLFSPVALNPPGNLFTGTSAGGNLKLANPANRTPNPTMFQLDDNVPRFQAANLFTTADSLGNQLYAGYEAVLNVFTDTSGSGKLQLNGAVREAYRTFNFGLGVGVDEHMSVLTPSVDLASLAEGTGLNLQAAEYNQRSPWLDAAVPGVQSPIYHSFTLVNDGNVNILNPRVAHGFNTLGNNPVGWPFYSTSVDDLAYLDGYFFLTSDLDPRFSLTSPNLPAVSPGYPAGPLPRGEVPVQKARVGSGSGNVLKTNPVNMANANLATQGGFAINPGAPIGLDARITVTPPIGFPVGSYSQVVRVIEDRNWQAYLNGGTGSPDDYNLSILLSQPGLNGNPPQPGESYADPSFILSFNVRESKLTNSSTINTASMADQNITAGAGLFADGNVEPAGMRDRAFGNLFFAWSSNRPAINNGAIGSATDYAYRIYMGTLEGATPATSPNPLNDASPLNELAFSQSVNGNQWFATAGAYPVGASGANGAAVNALFGIGGTDHVLGTNAGEADSVRFGQPALPSVGLLNPFVTPSDPTTDFNHALMAFTGNSDIQTATGRVSTNRLFVASVTPQQGAPAVVGAPIGSSNDTDMPKGKPSVVQVGADQAVIFYAGSTGGRSRLYYELYNAGTFSVSTPVPTGVGFDSATDPSAEARLYQGTDSADVAQSGHMIELSFSAKLRGRPNNEIFLTRIPTDVNGAPDKSNSSKSFLSYFPTRTLEQLEVQPTSRGLYRALGVGWNVGTTAALNAIDLGITTGGALPTSIIVAGSPRLYDPNSGILTLTTTLGTVYVDTFEGTVRFANSVPGTNYQVYANYQPQFLRISATKTASLTGPNLLWDFRRVGTPYYNGANFTMFDRYWYAGNGIHARLTNPLLLTDRYVVMYNRAADGPGQSARPLIETLRLGVQLPLPIPTLPNGEVDFGAIQVSNNNGPFQIDPTTGRIYFTAVDEDNVVTVNFLGVPTPLSVTFVQERGESPVTIEQAVNENHVTAFVDPFDPAGVANRRPDMVWLLWSSTRTGPSDIYFETIAPILWPVKK